MHKGAHDSRATAALAWDAFMLLLALGSVGLVLWFETADLTPQQRTNILRLDLLVVFIFLADWIAALLRAPDRARYVRRAWWEILGMIPLYVSSAGVLRFLRLLRVFRVLRAISRVHHLIERSRKLARDSNVLPLAIASSSITVVGATLVWFVEQDVPGSGMRHFSEALWWAIVTVTTVGYGDVTPVTTIGRGVAVVLMVSGIGTIGLLASQVSSALIAHQRAEAQPPQPPQPSPEEAPPAAEDVADLASQLARLAHLYDQGKLTDHEFAAAKAKLLSP